MLIFVSSSAIEGRFNPEMLNLQELLSNSHPYALGSCCPYRLINEWQIRQALNLILLKSTSILIAHRLSTVKAADQIVVMEKGRIIEVGNYQGLLDRGGHYATLYNTYFRHQSLDYRPDWVDDRGTEKLQITLD